MDATRSPWNPGSPPPAYEGGGGEFDYVGYRGVSLHPYPATMPGLLASDLILQNSQEGDLVLDPFAGSGTTLRAAAVTCRNSIGIDLNPLACLISSMVGTCGPTLQMGSMDGVRRRVLESITPVQVFPDPQYTPWVDRWFSPEAANRLAQLAAAIHATTDDPRDKEFALLAFSRTVRRSSLAKSGELKLWRRADAGRAEDPVAIFNREAVTLLRDMAVLAAAAPAGYVRPTVLHGDSQDVCKTIRNVDLVLTSPPYGDSWTTVAYGNFSLLSRIWLGAVDDRFVLSDPRREDALSPGGAFRCHRRSQWSDVRAYSQTLAHVYQQVLRVSEPRASELLRFFDHMYMVLEEIVQTLAMQGKLILVLGPRTVSGVVIDTGAVLAEFGESLGMVRTDRRSRRVTGKRLPTKTLQGANGIGETINAETIDYLIKESERPSDLGTH